MSRRENSYENDKSRRRTPEYYKTRGSNLSDDDEKYGDRDEVDNDERPHRTRSRSPSPKNEKRERYSRGMLSRYKKGREFKPSQFGRVRIGWDNEAEEHVVIKECLWCKVKDRRDVNDKITDEDIFQEFEIHRKISQDRNISQYIIKMLDVVRDEKYVYLILEHASEGELREHTNSRNEEITHELRRNKRSRPRCLEDWWKDSRRFMTQLLAAVKYLHGRKICHRDLSIENVVLDKYMNVKVIDFGLAHECEEDEGQDLPRVGKTKYMSPECWDDKRKYDWRDNDMWSLGVILFFMLFWRFPWNVPSRIDHYFRVIYGKRGGTLKFIGEKRLLRRAPKRVLDLFDRIFVAQKARITVKEALRHPYITNHEDDVFDPYFEDFPPALPDPTLQWKISELRYRQELELPPQVWLDLDLEKRDRIHEYLRRSDIITQSTVYDKRTVEDFAKKFRLTTKKTQEILIYFYAASRDKADLECIPEIPRARRSRRRYDEDGDRSPDERGSHDKPSRRRTRDRSPQDRKTRDRSPEDRKTRERSPYDRKTRDRYPQDRKTRDRSPQDRNRSPEGRSSHNKPSRRRDRSPQDRHKTPSGRNGPPRITMPMRIDEKYEYEESSNVDSDFRTPSDVLGRTPNDVFGRTPERETGRRGSRTNFSSPSINIISPSMVRITSFESVSTIEESPLVDRSDTDEYSPKTRR